MTDEEKITDGKLAEIEQPPTYINTIPPSPYTEARKASIDAAKLNDETTTILLTNKKKKTPSRSIIHFLYDPRKKTVLGRDSLNWGKFKFMSIKIILLI